VVDESDGYNLFVHTPETSKCILMAYMLIERISYYMRLFQAYNKNILIWGPPNSGKAAMIQYRIGIDLQSKELNSSYRYLKFNKDVRPPLTPIVIRISG